MRPPTSQLSKTTKGKNAWKCRQRTYIAPLLLVGDSQGRSLTQARQLALPCPGGGETKNENGLKDDIKDCDVLGSDDVIPWIESFGS
mmetsp:Transcript_64341/g.145112  ORF Transcript_64341/g.145112 Transcript_64341/m.145112 type:complete len:87 (-) Transcript_64341:1401-1661(-)